MYDLKKLIKLCNDKNIKTEENDIEIAIIPEKNSELLNFYLIVNKNNFKFKISPSCNGKGYFYINPSQIDDLINLLSILKQSTEENHEESNKRMFDLHEKISFYKKSLDSSDIDSFTILSRWCDKGVKFLKIDISINRWILLSICNKYIVEITGDHIHYASYLMNNLKTLGNILNIIEEEKNKNV